MNWMNFDDFFVEVIIYIYILISALSKFLTDSINLKDVFVLLSLTQSI